MSCFFLILCPSFKINKYVLQYLVKVYILGGVVDEIVKKVSLILGINEKNISDTFKLYDEGATIPFISRYRKEVTGGLNEEQIREIIDKITYEKNLEKRKEEVIRLIEEQGKLTEELKKEILEANVLQKVEDIYLPYKKKKKTKADIAKEKGLEPFAKEIYDGLSIAKISSEASKYITSEVLNEAEAIEGAYLILAQDLSENVKIREYLREQTLNSGIVYASVIEKNRSLDERLVYSNYYEFSEAVKKIASHKILAINRAEKEKILKVNIDFEDQDKLKIKRYMYNHFFKKANADMKEELIQKVVDDSYDRLLFPSIENEVRSTLTDRADKEAINIFATNLEALLLQPPILKKTILGLDPGIRTGCKLAVISKDGFYITSDVIYPVKGAHSEAMLEKSRVKLLKYIKEYSVDIIVIGNGTASRETESFVADAIKGLNCKYVIVNEAGASVYSASKLAHEEFPDLDVTVRGTISIARRIQDPLSELVKIDPKSIGVGMYQHDVNQKELEQKLVETIEKIVNRVGVNLNSASFSILSYVSGVKKNIAKNIVEYRKENGDFKSREELKNVKGLGAKAFEQMAGFVVIPDSINPLDNTIIHPESYPLAEKILELVESNPSEFRTNYVEIRQKLNNLGLKKVLKAMEDTYGKDTIKDVYEALLKDRRDPREDYPMPILKSDILTMEDLKEGMILEGTVRNATKFGVFVDIGLKNDAMIHISELSEKFVKDPTQVLTVGQIIKVRVLSVDKVRHRVTLSRKGVK